MGDHNQLGMVLPPGLLNGPAQFFLSSTDNIPLFQIRCQNAVQGLVTASGGVPVVESATPGAMDDGQDVLHLAHRADTSRDFAIDSKGM